MEAFPERASTRDIAEALGMAIPALQYWLRELQLEPVEIRSGVRFFDASQQQQIFAVVEKRGRPQQNLDTKAARERLMAAQRDTENRRDLRLNRAELDISTLQGQVQALLERRPRQVAITNNTIPPQVVETLGKQAAIMELLQTAQRNLQTEMDAFQPQRLPTLVADMDGVKRVTHALNARLEELTTHSTTLEDHVIAQREALTKIDTHLKWMQATMSKMVEALGQILVQSETRFSALEGELPSDAADEARASMRQMIDASQVDTLLEELSERSEP